jgi:hypothetical protein
VPRSSAKIPDPRHFGAEHRDKVPLSVHDGHYERKGDRTSRSTAHHLERDKVIRGDAQCIYGCPAPIQRASQGVGAAPSVEPALNPSPGQANLHTARATYRTAELEPARQARGRHLLHDPRWRGCAAVSLEASFSAAAASRREK